MESGYSWQFQGMKDSESGDFVGRHPSRLLARAVQIMILNFIRAVLSSQFALLGAKDLFPAWLENSRLHGCTECVLMHSCL